MIVGKCRTILMENHSSEIDDSSGGIVMEKEWYYRERGNQIGPISKQEIGLLIGQGKLSLDDYVWKQGYHEWIKARDSKELFGNAATPPPFTPELKTTPNMPEGRRTGLRVAAVLMFVSAALWLLISLFQIFYVVSVESVGSVTFDAAWNLIWSVATIAIGSGLWKQRQWAFRWGMTSAVVGVIWYALSFLSGSTLMLFFIIIELAIGILLFTNREYFKEHETAMS